MAGRTEEEICEEKKKKKGTDWDTWRTEAE